MRRVAAAIAIAGLLAAACATRSQRTEAERTVSDTSRGVRYVCPKDWATFDGEIRSPRGSLLSVRVYDLTDAEHAFVAGLPDTLLPQLTDWAKYYFIVDGPPTRAETQVAGAPATELTYPVRVKPNDPQTKVTYWVTRHGTRLFVLRAAYPASGLAEDEPAVRGVVAGWSFIEIPSGG